MEVSKKEGDRTSAAVATGTPCPYFNLAAILVSVFIVTPFIRFYFKQTTLLSSHPFVNEEQ